MNLPEIQKIMMEFEKQTEMMDMKEEMMDDAIDSALGDDDDEIEGYILNRMILIRMQMFKLVFLLDIVRLDRIIYKKTANNKFFYFSKRKETRSSAKCWTNWASS